MGNWTKTAVVGSENLPASVTIGTASYVWIGPGRVKVTIPYTAAALSGVVGVHVWEEAVNQSSQGGTPLNGTATLGGTTNLAGEWKPVDRGKFTESPVEFEIDGPAVAVQKRFYLNGYSETAEPELVRAGAPGATPSVLLTIAPAVYQSGVEYAHLVSGVIATAETDDTQVSGPKYRIRCQWTAPTDTPAAWQQAFGGCQIVFEQDSRRWNGSAMAINETDVRSDWWDLYVGTRTIRCWFVSYDNSETPRLNSIVAGVTPYADITIVWPLPGRPTNAPYADNVTDFSVFNPRYLVNGNGQKVLDIDWYWTRPNTPEAMARWGGAIIYLYLPSLTTPIACTGTEPGYYGTLSFDHFPAASETWTFRAISVDNNGNPNTDPIAPAAGTPTATISVGPPALGAPGSEYTAVVTGVSFAVSQVVDSNGATAPRVTGTFTVPTDPTWGGVEMRVYDGVTLVAKVSGQSSPIAVTLQNPGTSTTYTVKLVSCDVNGKTNTETGGTPQGNVLVGSAAGTLDMRKFLAGTISDTFEISGGKLGLKVTGAIEFGTSGEIQVKISGITSSLIAAGAVDAAKIATDAVTNTKIADDAISTPKLQANAITTAKLAANAVTANELAANAVVAGKIAANAVTATEILAGAVVAGKIASNAIAAANIQAGVISSDKLDANTINVGGGGSKPGKFAVFNASGAQIGFIGVESGNVGAWFQAVSIGGGNYASGKVRADTSGNVVMDGATFTLNLNGSTTSIQNVFDSGLAEYVGVKVRDNSGGYSAITPLGLYVLGTDDFTSLAAVVRTGSGSSAAGRIRCGNATGTRNVTMSGSASTLTAQDTGAGTSTVVASGSITINTNQVIGPRGASVANASQTAGAAYTATEQAMLNDLKTAIGAVISRMQAHGLIS